MTGAPAGVEFESARPGYKADLVARPAGTQPPTTIAVKGGT